MIGPLHRIRQAAVLVGLLPLGAGAVLADAAGAVAAPPLAERQVRYSFTLRNLRGDLLQEARFWVYAPLARQGGQECRRLEVAHPHEVLSDAVGNQVLCFTFTNLPPYAAKIVTIEGDLTLAPHAVPEPVEPAAWRNPAYLLETDHEAFDRLAPDLQGGDERETARQVFDWVRGHVRRTSYLRRDRGALYALQNGQGDCTESACLFAALCRRQGIQARVLGGYGCDRNRVLAPPDYHNWAEFYWDGAWHLADPHENVFMEGYDRYVKFHVMEGTDGPVGSFPRFRYEGEGLQVRMN